MCNPQNAYKTPTRQICFRNFKKTGLYSDSMHNRTNSYDNNINTYDIQNSNNTTITYQKCGFPIPTINADVSSKNHYYTNATVVMPLSSDPKK